jgi:hypothetical protein
VSHWHPARFFLFTVETMIDVFLPTPNLLKEEYISLLLNQLPLGKGTSQDYLFNLLLSIFTFIK